MAAPAGGAAGRAPFAEAGGTPLPDPDPDPDPDPSNALVTIFRALVTSLGITQTVLPSPCASCGSVCRYW